MCACMYVCMHVYARICVIYIYIHICIYIYTSKVSLSVSIYPSIYLTIVYGIHDPEKLSTLLSSAACSPLPTTRSLSQRLSTSLNKK